MVAISGARGRPGQRSLNSGQASQLIPGYPAQPTGGNPLYTAAVSQLDSDMAQYIHDNTEDELSHETFINAYLASKGAETVSLDQFRTLPSGKATGANLFGRLTKLTQLSVDTSWWTRYRSRTQNSFAHGNERCRHGGSQGAHR